MSASRISFWVGFISLSLEICWVRLYGYANLSTPIAFSYVLFWYLMGISIGAYFGKFLCRTPATVLFSHVAKILLVSAPIIVVAPWLYEWSRQYALDDLIAPISIVLTAGVLASLFPIMHHIGTLNSPESKVGSTFSSVYVMNVIGAGLGPLVTGYFLFNSLTIDFVFILLGVVTLLIGISSSAGFRGHAIAYGAIGFLALAAVTTSTTSGKLRLVKAFSAEENPIKFVSENRYGIITISDDKNDEYTVFGGNVYDGKVNTDIKKNTNGLERPLVLHVLNPSAKSVLVLGLSIGSWLTVVEGFPHIENIDVVEINPGYLDLAKNFPHQYNAISDPRVSMHIDDARRWLRANPDKRYDIILMNTTWHWRANSSMLLSREMMALIQGHLTQGGIVAFNATGSTDAFYTASKVFPYTRRYQNFIYGSNLDQFSKAKEFSNWNVLLDVKTIPPLSENPELIRRFSKIPFATIQEDASRLSRSPEIITDDNMLTEYKYGRKF